MFSDASAALLASSQNSLTDNWADYLISGRYQVILKFGGKSPAFNDYSLLIIYYCKMDQSSLFAEPKMRVSVGQFAAKATRKVDIYRLLTTSARIYLPI